MTPPFVSVLMPIFNGEKFLDESIVSILKQSYTNFEFLIIDDGSTDNTSKLLKRYKAKDKRIKIITHKKNLGIVISLNEGLDRAKGKYILRMDADDIAYPNRFVEQIRFMEANPGVGVCGTWIKVLTNQPYVWKSPTNDADIKTSLFFESVIAHPSACIRTSALKQLDLKYDQKYIYVEDYNLWLNLSKNWELANIPIPLLEYRSHSLQTSAVKGTKQSQNLLILKSRLLKSLYPKAESKDFSLHQIAMGWPVATSLDELFKLRDWYKLLINQNKKLSIYPQHKFAYKIAEKWVGVCHLAKNLGIKRYLYIFTLPRLVFPGIYIIMYMKLYSVNQYIKATIKRFV